MASKNSKQRGRPISRLTPTRMINARVEERLFLGVKAKAVRLKRTITSVLESAMEREIAK